MPPAIQFTQIQYPESDGKPMGETDVHRDEMMRIIELLKEFFRGEQVYVSGNLLLYFEQGKPRKFVVPDAFIVKGLPPHSRRVYKLWVERKSPDLVIETTSRKTRRKDTKEKPELYARLGVKEYFLFDPHQEYLDPPLQGHRLEGASFAAIAPDQDGSITSQELGLRLCVDGEHLQFFRLDNGERLLMGTERADLATQRAEHEAEARRAAEAEVARLREELARRPPA